jgi:hypothetical protein
MVVKSQLEAQQWAVQVQSLENQINEVSDIAMKYLDGLLSAEEAMNKVTLALRLDESE